MTKEIQTRRTFLKNLSAGTAFLSIPLLHCRQLNPKQKPNIIYILADDLGYGDLGCYGQQNIKTPNLDKMSAEGIRFTDHYAGSTVCAPSRCTLMTGQHTGHARIRGNATVPLKPEDMTVAEMLQKSGYVTGLIGKWGLGEQGTTGIPNRKGFNFFYGYLNQIRAHNYYPEWLWENQTQIQLDNKVVFSDSGYAKGIGTASTNKVTYSHDLFTQQALNFIENNKNQNFFLYLAYTIPHANNQYQLVNSEHGMEVPEYGIYKDLDWPAAQKGHAAIISRMDRDIGVLLNTIKELGLDENTIIMFSSDNGPHKEGGADPDFNHSSGKLKGKKRDLYEGGIRVPMIARWPGKIQPNTVTDHVSAFWDVLPTCAHLAGVAHPDKIDGLSFLPVLLGKISEQQQHEFLYWEFHEGQYSKVAVRMGDWKAVRLAPHSLIELYDLKNDREENKNIASQNQDIVKKIEKYLKKARTKSEHWEIRS